MIIEIWSDIVCPYCYVGKRKLEEALELFPHKDEVEINYKSYQLDPDASVYAGQDYFDEWLADFRSATQMNLTATRLVAAGRSVGIDFNLDMIKPTNSFDAHRLTKLAKAYHKDLVLTEKLLKAHFTDGIDISNHEDLANIAEDVGLSRDDALTMLADRERFAKEVQADIDEAHQLHIPGVPYFLINRKYAISGAQPIEVFTSALEKASKDTEAEPILEDLSADGDLVCGIDGCEIPAPKE